MRLTAMVGVAAAGVALGLAAGPAAGQAPLVLDQRFGFADQSARLSGTLITFPRAAFVGFGGPARLQQALGSGWRCGPERGFNRIVRWRNLLTIEIGSLQPSPPCDFANTGIKRVILARPGQRVRTPRGTVRVGQSWGSVSRRVKGLVTTASTGRGVRVYGLGLRASVCGGAPQRGRDRFEPLVTVVTRPAGGRVVSINAEYNFSEGSNCP